MYYNETKYKLTDVKKRAPGADPVGSYLIKARREVFI